MFTPIQEMLKRRSSMRPKSVFGNPLMNRLNTERSTVPMIVRKCVAELALRGLQVEGKLDLFCASPSFLENRAIKMK